MWIIDSKQRSNQRVKISEVLTIHNHSYTDNEKRYYYFRFEFGNKSSVEWYYNSEEEYENALIVIDNTISTQQNNVYIREEFEKIRIQKND